MAMIDPPKKSLHERVRERVAALISTPEFGQAWEQAKAAGKQGIDENTVVRYVTDQMMHEEAQASGDELPSDPMERLNTRAINFNKSLLKGVTAPLAALEHGAGKWLGLKEHPIADLRQQYLEPTYDPNPLANVANIAGETGGEFVSTGVAMRPAMAGARLIPGMGAAGNALANAAGKVGGGVIAQGAARALPSEIAGNLAYQGATDPQSLTTPGGAVQGVGFGVLGALMHGAGAVPRTTGIPDNLPRGVIPMQPQGPSLRDIMLSEGRPRPPEPDPIAQIVQSRQQVASMQPDPNLPNIDQNRVLQQVFGTAPDVGRQTAAMVPPPATVQGPQLRPFDPFHRDAMDLNRLNPTAGTPFASNDPISVMQEAQAGPPQGPASPPRPDFWSTENPNVTPPVPGSRPQANPDIPFQQLYPDTPPVKPMTPTGYDPSKEHGSPDLDPMGNYKPEHLDNESVAAEVARLKAENAALRGEEVPAPRPVKVTRKGGRAATLKPTSAASEASGTSSVSPLEKPIAVAFRDPNDPVMISVGRPGENHGMLQDRVPHTAGWTRGFVDSRGNFISGESAPPVDGRTMHAADLPEGANKRVGYNPNAKPIVVSKGKSTVDPLAGVGEELPAAPVSGPGRMFSGEPEYVQRLVEGGNGRREWVPNDNYTRKVKLAQENGTYAKLSAEQATGGGPAEGEPFPEKPKRKASTKPRVKRQVKPKPIDGTEPTG